ncbi:unnamed protein product, partial [marine sediment metagenome]
MKNKISLFIDSGAFSAFTKKVKIDIQEYIKFIKDNVNCIEVYANLDVIGSAEGTLKNQEIMEKAGLNPLPCFHYGEDIKYLEHYISKYEYIALGGMVPISTKDLSVWLDWIFPEYLCDKKGMPKVKVHGFGMTALKLMLRYPWYSVDSTSWVVAARLGQIYIPKIKSGKYDYKASPWKVIVSEKSPNMKEEGKHFHSFSKLEREMIINYLGEKSYTVEDLQDYKKRDELNIIYYLDLEKDLP